MGTYQSEFEVHLPIGYVDAAGKIHRRALLRKMRGHEEAILYDPTFAAGRLVTELLTGCLVRLGELETVDANAVAQLFSADRNYLMLELRRITLGDRLQASYQCPGCNASVAVVEDLGNVEVRRLEDEETLEDITLTLEDGYIDQQGNRHTELTLSLPRGEDEEFVTPMVAKDPLKAQDALILRCIKRFGKLPKAALEAYGVKILRDLTLGDRQRLQNCFNGQSPGVNFVRTVQCGACGIAFEGLMDVSNFFVSG
jgi:hypothetical protein